MKNKETETIVKVDNVSMRFNLSKEKIDSMKEYFVKFLKQEIVIDEFYALRHVSLEIEQGQSFAIIGENGCGKSTLLKLISGIFYPSEGSVTIHGTIAPLIELGAGFDPDLTARENIYLNGALLGYSKEFMEERFQEIMDFAELWDFVDVPIKNYSSGMVARLGFSIATIVTPNILIVDEILSVGDVAFQQKCEDKMNQMIAEGATLIFVSHSTDQVRRMCKKAIWLKNGIPQLIGEVNEVCDAYLYDLENGRHGLITLNDLECQNKVADLAHEGNIINEKIDGKNVNFFCVLCMPAIFLILWDHLGALWPSGSGIQWSVQQYVSKYFTAPLGLIQNGSFFGICLLFIVIGFFATHMAYQNTRTKFLLQSFIRIFPPIIISTFFFYIFQRGIGHFIWQGATYWGQFSIKDWLYSSILIEGLTGHQSINGSTWAILSSVLFCIILFILINMLKQSPKKYLSSLSIICALIIFINKYGVIDNGSIFFHCSYIIYLLFGQIFYLFWSKKIRLREFIYFSVIEYIILLLNINNFYPEYLALDNSYVVSFLLAYNISFVLILLSKRISEVKIFIKFAKLSYSLYLTHMTFGFLFLSVLSQYIVNYTILFFLTILFITIISYVQYQFVEKPFIKLGERIN